MTTGVAFTVQEYAEDQAQDVVALLKACGWQDNAIPTYEVLAEAEMTGCAYVAIVDDRVAGFIRVLSDGDVCTYITEVAVAVDVRCQGVGRALVDAVAQEFPRARIDLLSTQPAQPFYEEIGFVSKPGYRRWPT